MRRRLDIGPANEEEAALAERRAMEILEGFLALRWRSGWSAGRSHCFVVRRDGEVVSSVFVMRVPFHWPRAGSSGRPAAGMSRGAVAGSADAGRLPVRDLACLESLVTPARFRGNGYASTLLEWVYRWAVERGLAGTALFSEIGTAYYRARGYRVLPMPFHRGPLPETADGLSRDGRPFVPGDLRAVVSAYHEAAGRHPFSVARDRPYWDYHLDHSRFVEDLHSEDPDPWDFTVDSDAVRAYTRNRSDGDIYTVLEAVARPGEEGTLAALIGSGLRRAVEDGCLRVVLHLPPGVLLPPGLDLRTAWYRTFLVRPAPGEDHVPDLGGAPERIRSDSPYIFRPDYF